MSNIPSIAMIPSAFRSGKVYSVLPTDGSGDLNFARASEATRVNKDGLIETVGSNVPRIDYTDGGCPKLLLEPQSTNLITYSEAFDNAYWIKTRSSITSNSVTAPNGTLTAYKLVDNTVDEAHRFISTGFSTTSVNYTASIFVKKDEIKYAYLRVNDSGGTYISGTFDLQDGIVTQEENGDLSIENFGNGWYRIIGTATSNANGLSYLELRTSKTPIYSNYIGNGSDGLYIWGAQLEQGSYATSYIPTSGSAVTRLADVCNNGGNEQVINSTEGVLYFEGSALADGSVDKRIYIDDGTMNNYVAIGYSRFAGNIISEIISGGVLQTVNWGATGVNQTNNNKFALSWGSGTMKFYVNGTQTNTESVTSPTGLNVLEFNTSINTLFMEANVKDVRVYNTTLTDAELQALTQV